MIVVLVGASLDHVPPTVVRLFVAIASQCLTITQLALRVIPNAVAQWATRKTNGFPGLWVLYFPPNEHPTIDLHLDSCAHLLHRLDTGTSATLRISAAEICSPYRYLLPAVTVANEEGLAVSQVFKTQDGERSVFLSRLVFVSSLRLVRHVEGIRTRRV